MKVIDDDDYISAVSTANIFLSRESVIIHLKIFTLLKLWHFGDGDVDDY
jgi:hypothetical protein